VNCNELRRTPLLRLSEKDLEVVWSAGAGGQKQRERRLLAPLIASWRPGLELIRTFQTSKLLEELYYDGLSQASRLAR